MKKSLTIACMADTHGLHREIDVPHCDLLIHAGDFTMFSRSVSEIRDFNEWLGDLPCPSIVIPGNHEFFLERDLKNRALLSNATVLINEAAEIMGLKIWGSPTTPLYSGAFGLSSEADRREIYSHIPDDIDILITHGPPLSILDRSADTPGGVGCPMLMETVKRIRPTLHVFGHVHGAYGAVDDGDTLFLNVALLGCDGDLEKRPYLIRF